MSRILPSPLLSPARMSGWFSFNNERTFRRISSKVAVSGTPTVRQCFPKRSRSLFPVRESPPAPTRKNFSQGRAALFRLGRFRKTLSSSSNLSSRNSDFRATLASWSRDPSRERSSSRQLKRRSRSENFSSISPPPPQSISSDRSRQSQEDSRH